VEDPEHLVGFRILPNNKLLGPRFGAEFPQVRAALAGLPAAEVAKQVEGGGGVDIDLSSGTAHLEPEEVLVETVQAEGIATASDRFVTVGIDTEITPELRAEGLAREVVRRVQDLRKQAGFNIEDRIKTWFSSGDVLAGVIEDWRAYIKAETLSVELVRGEAERQAFALPVQSGNARLIKQAMRAV